MDEIPNEYKELFNLSFAPIGADEIDLYLFVTENIGIGG